MAGEDQFIPRVPVSTSIGGCLTGIPGGGRDFKNTNYDDNGNVILWRLFIIDIDKLNIDINAIMDWRYLYRTGYVPDALYTEECWIQEEFEVPKEDSYIIKITDWEEHVEDLVRYNVYKEAMLTDGDLIRVHGKYNDNNYIPSIVRISNVEYEIIE